MSDVVTPALKMYAESLDDLEEVRIRMENRLRSMTQFGESENGYAFGLGLDPEDPSVKKYAELVTALAEMEKSAIKFVQKEMRTSALGPFVKNAKGVGEKQAARLLAAVGDPYWHPRDDRPRTVSELWAYCGLDVRSGAAPARTKGKQSNWNSEARKRAWLIAKSVEKQTTGKYREIYDDTKAHYAGGTHTVPCARCTPAGAKPAEVGTEMKPAHIQSRALRKVAKEILKDMWIASRDYHAEQNPLPMSA